METQAFNQLQALIANGAWLQEASQVGFGPKIAIGEAVWIDGRGLLFAELWAEHQGHVHLIEGARIQSEASMVDVLAEAGDLSATIHAMSADEASVHKVTQWRAKISADDDAGRAWRAAWASELTGLQAE